MKTWGFISLLVALAWGEMAVAQECCDRCGCQSCRKVCRVVCDVKKVPHTTYTCECEDFCVPKRSERCGTTCECDCNGHPHRKPNFVPTCATVRTKNKLIKHVEEKEVKTYKWVVEYLCDDCCNAAACTAGGEAAAAANAPEGAVMDEEFSRPSPPMSANRPASSTKPVSFLQSIFGGK
jgi:hypothetical protein